MIINCDGHLLRQVKRMSYNEMKRLSPTNGRWKPTFHEFVGALGNGNLYGNRYKEVAITSNNEVRYFSLRRVKSLYRKRSWAMLGHKSAFDVVLNADPVTISEA